MKVRIRYAKLGKVRFTSHRDLCRMLERAFRRTETGLAYSEGFSPRPKLHFGLALPTGAESIAEYFDADLLADPTPALAEQLTAAMPEGIDVLTIAPLAPGTPSLQEHVQASSWWVELVTPRTETPTTRQSIDLVQFETRIRTVSAASALPFEMKRKDKVATEDLREALLDLSVQDAVTQGRAAFTCVLATQPRSYKPADLAGVIDPSLCVVRMVRLAQSTIRSTELAEPLALSPDAIAPHISEWMARTPSRNTKHVRSTNTFTGPSPHYGSAGSNQPRNAVPVAS